MFFGRGKNKIKDIIGYGDMYKEYRETTKDNSLYNIDKNTYNNIIDDYWKAVAELLISGEEIKLPSGFGPMSVKKRKLGKSYPVDWKATVEVGKLVLNFNEHTNGRKPFFLWSLDKAKIVNINYYRFKPCRGIARALAKKIKEEHQDYYEH